MSYGVVKIGDGLIGIGLQPGSALKDAGVQSARRIPITTGRLGQYSIVELSDDDVRDREGRRRSVWH